MTLKEIQLKYLKKSKRAGSLFLLKPPDAIEYIDDCNTEGFKLCGVEGFKITNEGAFQPQQEHSNDVTETELDYEEFVEGTKQFIREREEMGIWFEIIFSKGK